LRLIDVNAPVLKRDGKVYTEPVMDPRGRVVLEPDESGKEKEPKFAHQLLAADVPSLEEKRIGQIMNHALDQTDPSISAEEGRKRFLLSCRILQAMDDGVPLEADLKDEQRIAAAGDLLVKANFMFVARITEALEKAPPKGASANTDKSAEKSKANGAEAAA